ncbi:MAG: glycine oxidase ThiO [Pyrinomonadaceae bacterium]|nr:glycine oxidase ThiO [Pyrinomonadaceae bacterium]MCX7639799.1 glycine oxidase ThiO [Pyrinomonadaceae bacterium]MDW8304382.1 glycine oxidase ThiO [Acidobacteriota bacterium]
MPVFSEVLIVGGGIIGLALARALKIKGFKKITIVDKSNFGQEASYAAAGMLSPQVEADRDDSFFRFCLQANRIYPSFVKELEEETGIDVEFNAQGTFLLAFCEEESLKLMNRYKWQKEAGLNVEYLEAGEIRRLEPFVSPSVFSGLFFSDDGQVENRKLVVALQKYARLKQIEMVKDTQIVGLETENETVLAITDKGGSFLAEVVILAAGAFTSQLIIDGIQQVPSVKPIRGQMIAFQAPKQAFKHVIYTERGYLVPRKSGRILVGATIEDVGFDKSVTERGIQFLLNVSRQISPSLSSLKIAEKWAGLRPMAEDGLPIIGELPYCKNVFVATAHYRNGILLAPLTAEILAARIAENAESVYLKEFSPARFV